MSISMPVTAHPTGRMPTFSMLVAAYGLVEHIDHQASVQAAAPAGAPISRMLMPCEAPFCDRLARALVCEFHRPGVLT